MRGLAPLLLCSSAAAASYAHGLPPAPRSLRPRVVALLMCDEFLNLDDYDDDPEEDARRMAEEEAYRLAEDACGAALLGDDACAALLALGNQPSEDDLVEEEKLEQLLEIRCSSAQRC